MWRWIVLAAAARAFWFMELRYLKTTAKKSVETTTKPSKSTGSADGFVRSKYWQIDYHFWMGLRVPGSSGPLLSTRSYRRTFCFKVQVTAEVSARRFFSACDDLDLYERIFSCSEGVHIFCRYFLICAVLFLFDPYPRISKSKKIMECENRVCLIWLLDCVVQSMSEIK